MIADELPGFAGIFFDSNQQLVVQLTHVDRLVEARTKVREFLGRQVGDDEAVSTEYDRIVSEMTARRARYNFRQLHTWRRLITDEIASLDATIMFTDIDEMHNRIAVGVKDAEDIGSVAADLERLGVPQDALFIQHAPGKLVSTASLQGTVRPVIGGVQIRTTGRGACTLGFNVDHSNSGYWFFVTNSHCTSQFGVSNGNTFGQPTEGSAVGTEVADSPVLDHDDDEDCPDDGRDCINSDAALIRYTTSSWTHGKIAWPGDTGTINYSNTIKITSDGGPVQGMMVQKVGRTTGRTYGQVTNACWDGWYYYNWPATADSVWAMCQGRASYRAEGGDSGSPVVWQLWGSTVAVGINFGSDSVISAFSPGPLWRSDLGDEVNGTLYTDIGHSPPPSVTISGPTTVHPDWWCTWNAYGSGGVPPYSYTWSGVLSGTGGSIGGMLSSSGDLRVTIEDDVEHTDTAYLYITVSESAPYHPNCSEEDDDNDT